MKLYLITETESGDHSNTYLSDVYEKSYSRGTYSIRSVEATINDVTLDMMIEAVESDMESANYHSQIFLPGWIAGILSKHLPEAEVKEIFWDMIQDKGLLWRE